MYKIGIQFSNYPETRNILNKIDDASYIKKVSFKETPRYLELFFRVIKKIERVLKIKNYFIKPYPNTIFAFKSNYQKDIHFFHFFNSILYGKNKWGVTFETLVPYHDQNIINIFLRDEKVVFNSKDAVKKISKKNCKFIIAISECSYKIQSEYLNYFPRYKDKILSKTHILHPPQKVLMNKYKKPNFSKGINFMFVGSEFLCKGGIEILRVFNTLKNTYPNFNLILIGDFNRSNGRCVISKSEMEELQSIIKENKDRIKHFVNMPNNEVLNNMVNIAHVGLLPTHADTYGYSVLEFQSAGCPVISTNGRALKEINNEDCGWMIDVSKSKLGEPLSRTEEELQSMQSSIEKQLLIHVEEILKNPDSIKDKALKSIERIKKNHCPLNYSNELSSIYDNVK